MKIPQRDPNEAELEALEHARMLARAGVPIFLAKPALMADGFTWDSDGGHGGTGYRLPKDWQRRRANPAVVDRWRPGDALCAVTGAVVDVVDIDPRNGGDEEGDLLSVMPTSYGRQYTPSGGTHDIIASLGVASRDGVFPGVDVKAGTPDGRGRGFFFLAPTMKVSKATGSVGTYRWVKEPDLSGLEILGPDVSGAGLREAIEGSRARGSDEWDGEVSYDGEAYADLNDRQRAAADAYLQEQIDNWSKRLEEAADWDEGVCDDLGRGWEALARDWAWACAMLAAAPWVPLDDEQAQDLHDTVLPDVIADDPKCSGKYDADVREKAGAAPVSAPPWDRAGADFERVPGDEGATNGDLRVDVSNVAEAAAWLWDEVGKPGTPLSGMFYRSYGLMYTPRIGEEGYVPAESSADGPANFDGPAQIRPMDPATLQSRVQTEYRVLKWVASSNGGAGGWKKAVFPLEATKLVINGLDAAESLRRLNGVTHTPFFRADGVVVDDPGYDARSARLFLPDLGFEPARVPVEPTGADVRRARELLETMLVDFPWTSPHDRANYLLLMFTPLLRDLVPPPYKMGLIGAHQRGSGKSLLAYVLRTLHGGVFRGDIPKDGEEIRKQITAILTGTTAAVVQWDNVKKLESTNLDALLTSDVWSDRILGRTEEASARNDRLWIATGNNVEVRGDLARRVLKIMIDPGMSHPESRTQFAIPDLKAYVRDERGKILAAMLTILRGWHLAERPTPKAASGDDYGRWIAIGQGVLEWAGLAGEEVGMVDHPTTRVIEEEDDDTAAWAQFLREVHEATGGKPWFVKDVPDYVSESAVPDEMDLYNTRSMGKWLSNRQGKWSGGYTVKSAGSADGVKKWRVLRDSQ